jgi:hypothetical protein
MFEAVNHLVNGVKIFFQDLFESEEEKYRRKMMQYLNQATDRIHLEYLEREWDKTNGRRYY